MQHVTDESSEEKENLRVENCVEAEPECELKKERTPSPPPNQETKPPSSPEPNDSNTDILVRYLKLIYFLVIGILLQIIFYLYI